MALSRDQQAQVDLKKYLALLDMTSRQNLLKELQEMLSAQVAFPEAYPVFWNLLYAKNMRCVRVPAIATSSSDVYANIFSALGSIVGEMLPSTTQELHLDCYRKAPPASFREKGLVFNLIEGFRNVTKLNLGLGCDDSLLKEIAR